MKYLPLWSAVLLLCAACHAPDDAPASVVRSDVEKPEVAAADPADPRQFTDYWYSGQGELNSYALTQWRYGEPRQGEAVLVFVTEPFSEKKQVKLDHPEADPADEVSVLKLNHIRKFPTGVYDYSMMTSVFTPVDSRNYPQTLKLTATSQEWCGHTFMQFNLKGRQYRMQLFSYFESEGDRAQEVRAAMFEDEIFSRLRLDPAMFRDEQVLELIPAAHYLRLHHQAAMPRQARIRHQQQESGTWLIVEYLHLPRTLRIRYETEFPYRILEWQEDDDGRLTRAVLRQTLRLPYWQHHDNADLPLRDSLQLICF